MIRKRLYASVVAISSSLVFAGRAAPAEEPVIEYRCGVTGRDMPATPEGGVPLVRVLQLKKADPVKLPAGADPAKQTVTCARSLLVPSVNDGKVLKLGFEIFIGAGDKSSGKPRVGLLTGAKPNIVFLILEGKQTKSEVATTTKVLKELNGR